jgi:N-acetylmuramoyl-L-alanine amidase
LISLAERSRLTRSLKADVFLSLHCNTSRTTPKGIEVYLHNSDNLNTKESILLGLSVLNESSLKLGFKKRGVKFSNFQVLRETSPYYPAILIEMGFVTNYDEANYFLKPSNKRAMALAILMGLYNYLNMEL